MINYLQTENQIIGVAESNNMSELFLGTSETTASAQAQRRFGQIHSQTLIDFQNVSFIENFRKSSNCVLPDCIEFVGPVH